MAKKVKYTQPLLGERNAAGDLILVPGAVVQILQDGAPVTVYSDADGTEIDTPAVPSGVASGSAGVSTRGELTVWLEPGSGYSGVSTVGQQATTFPIPDISPDAADVAAAATTRLANTQTVDYVLVLADAGKAVEINSATPKNVTVPPNSSVAFPVGTIIEVPQVGAGVATVVAGAGVTITGDTVTPGQGGSLLLRKTGTNTWWSAIWSVRSGTYVVPATTTANTAALVFSTRVSGDSQARLQLLGDAVLDWGTPGNLAVRQKLYPGTAGLEVDTGSFTIRREVTGGTQAPELHYRGKGSDGTLYGWLTGMDVAGPAADPTTGKHFVVVNKLDWPNPGNAYDFVNVLHGGAAPPVIGVGGWPPDHAYLAHFQIATQDLTKGTLRLGFTPNQTGDVLDVKGPAASTLRCLADGSVLVTTPTSIKVQSVGLVELFKVDQAANLLRAPTNLNGFGPGATGTPTATLDVIQTGTANATAKFRTASWGIWSVTCLGASPGTVSVGTSNATPLNIQTAGANRITIAATGAVDVPGAFTVATDVLSVSGATVTVKSATANSFRVLDAGNNEFLGVDPTVNASRTGALLHGVGNVWAAGGTPTATLDIANTSTSNVTVKARTASWGAFTIIVSGSTPGTVSVGTSNATPMNLQTSNATRIALSSTGGIGFFGVAAVAQPAGIVDADGTLADITTKFNSLLAKMESLGLLAVA